MNFRNYSGLLGMPSKEEEEVETSDRYAAPADEKEFGVRIEIDKEVYDKIMHWVDKSEFEVSGLGLVEYDEEENVLKVTEAILLPQKNTSVTTELDGQAVAKAMYDYRNHPGQLKWWWHSHVNMDVFWSGTDLATIKQLGSGGWMVATVFNQKREMKSAFCQVEPIRMIVDDIDTEVMEVIDEDLVASWDEEYDNLVENVPFVSKWTGSTPIATRAIPVDDDDDAPEMADLFPQEYDDEDRPLTDDEEELLTYHTLDELYELKEQGNLPERVWDEAIERASDSEVDEFFQCQEMEGMDIRKNYHEEEW